MTIPADTDVPAVSRLLVLGAGGHGAVVADAAEAIGHWSEIVFIDDAYPKLSSVTNWHVIGDNSMLKELSRNVEAAVVAVGRNDVRLSLIDSVERAGIPLATLIHPSAYVSSRASIGRATVLLANSVVNARASIGLGCIVNTAATVDHDCYIGDGVHISPGANLAANVSVGKCSWIGIGSAVREKISVGSNVIVGAGSAVIRDVADGAVVGGAPAKPINSARG